MGLLNKKKTNLDDLRKERPSLNPGPSAKRKHTNGKTGSILGAPREVLNAGPSGVPEEAPKPRTVEEEHLTTDMLGGAMEKPTPKPPAKKRGRPKGSKNKPKAPPAKPPATE